MALIRRNYFLILLSATFHTQTLAVIFSMKIQLLILGLLTILSCSTKPNSETDIQGDTINSDTQSQDINEEQKELKSDTILYTKQVLHHFSSTVESDTFKIIVTGQSIKNGQFKFQIISKDKGILFDENFETRMLLDFSLKPNPTDKDIEDHIKNRIDKFFNEDRFRQPAVSENDTFDEDYGEKEIWEDIASDRTAIGFYYLIAEEDGRHIAYSKRKKTTVQYYTCC